MAFQSNTSIINGLPSVGNSPKVCFFEYSGNNYLITGSNSGVSAFKWNNSESIWEVYTPMKTFNGTTLATANYPTVFQYSDNLYLIFGNSSATFTGYIWSETNQQWETNTTIKTGLPDIGTYSYPEAFWYNSVLYLIATNGSGTFYAYTWNGSTWTVNSTILTGLSAVTNASPAIGEINGKLCLLTTNGQNGQSAFYWDSVNITWVSDSTIITGYTKSGYYCEPNLFTLNNTLYLVYIGSYSQWTGNVYVPGAKISSYTFTPNENYEAEFNVLLSQALNTNETLIAYLSPTAEGLGNPAYLVALTTVDGLNYTGSVAWPDATDYYLAVYEVYNSSNIDSKTSSGTFYQVEQKTTTIINVVAPNYLLPAVTHSNNHGLLYFNGYIYGSARAFTDTTGSGIIKIDANDYNTYQQQKIYPNKNSPSGNGITKMDQIKECSGFLWVQYSGGIIRINATDLDYMIFSMPETATQNQPIGTDGTYLYYQGDISVYKLDSAELIGSFASYGYTGDAPVAIPEIAIMGTALVIQVANPTYNWLSYVHAFIADNENIYLSIIGETQNSATVDGVFLSHFQKIRKSDMVTVGDIEIPNATDDIVQNSEYIFLLPELIDSAASPDNGKYWGLFAVKKSTLEIKYLKALHSDYSSPTTPSQRQGYGIFLFGQYIAAQLVVSKKTFIIDLSDIENWGPSFPIGAATESIYSFQVEGVNLTVPLNELVYDSVNGWVHVNTWEQYTRFLKFPIASITPVTGTDPVIQTLLINSDDADATFRGIILDTGASAMTSVGFRYGTDPGNLSTNVPSTLGSTFQETLLSLVPGVYYIQAWGTNTEGTWYGNTVVFSTYNVLILANDTDDAVLDYISHLFGCSIRCVQDAPGIPDGTTGPAADVDGNTYDTIVINGKRWFKQNLKTTKFRNGENVPNEDSEAGRFTAEEWAALAGPGRCKYEN